MAEAPERPGASPRPGLRLTPTPSPSPDPAPESEPESESESEPDPPPEPQPPPPGRSRWPRLVLVSPLSHRGRDGQGDQRRAHAAWMALGQDWDVEVVSWLPDAEQSLGRSWRAHPVFLLRAAALSAVLPVHVASVQAFAPRSWADRLGDHAVILYVTDRSVPWRRRGRRRRGQARVEGGVGGPYVIDFIDDLGGAAVRRASTERGLTALFWRWEGRRLRRFDARLAAAALRAVAVTEHDPAAIGPPGEALRQAIGTRPMPDIGTTIAFTGNLFYPPFLEAATWICEELVPELARRGLDRKTVVIAGRRPPPSLTGMCCYRRGHPARPMSPTWPTRCATPRSSCVRSYSVRASRASCSTPSAPAGRAC